MIVLIIIPFLHVTFYFPICFWVSHVFLIFLIKAHTLVFYALLPLQQSQWILNPLCVSVCVSLGHFSAPSPCTKTAQATWALFTSLGKSPHWSRMALRPATVCWLNITSVKSTDKTLLDSRSDTRFCLFNGNELIDKKLFTKCSLHYVYAVRSDELQLMGFWKNMH